MRDINVLIGEVSEEDKKLFFSDLKGNYGEVEWLKGEWKDFPSLLKDIGIFKSTSDASRNGWHKGIPLGFIFPFKIGKLKTKVTILNLTRDLHTKLT